MIIYHIGHEHGVRPNLTSTVRSWTQINVDLRCSKRGRRRNVLSYKHSGCSETQPRFRDWYLDRYISSFRHGKCFYINLTLPIPGYTALCSNSVDFDMLSVCVCVLYLMIDFFLYHITQGLSEATLLYTFTCHFIRYRFNKMLIIPQWFWSILTW